MSYRETASGRNMPISLVTAALLGHYLGMMFLDNMDRPIVTLVTHPCIPKRAKRRVCSPAPRWKLAGCGYARPRILKSHHPTRAACNPCGLLPYPSMLRSCFMLRSGLVTIPTCDCDWCMRYRVGCEQGARP